MVVQITFFPVGNGDITLILLADAHATSLLVDDDIGRLLMILR